MLRELDNVCDVCPNSFQVEYDRDLDKRLCKQCRDALCLFPNAVPSPTKEEMDLFNKESL